MNISRIGIDLAKNVFQLHGVDRHGKAVWKRRLKRDQWLKALLDQAGLILRLGGVCDTWGTPDNVPRRCPNET